MSKEPISKGDQDVSRRKLLKKAALAVGAATSVAAARTALARSTDVVMDSAGRVLIHGAALPAPEGSFETALKNNAGCNNEYSCTGGSNKQCTNERNCVAPNRAMQPSGAGPKVNAPLTGPKVNAPLSGGSSGGGSRK
jgi:hypothetical protein